MTGAASEILLLPGLDGTGRLFRWLEAAYAGPIPLRAVRYPANPGLGYRELTDYARGLIGTNKVIVLGESFSGPIALELAASMPDQVKGLILAATFVRSPYPHRIMRVAALGDPGWVPRGLFNTILRGRRTVPDIDAEMTSVLAELPPEVRARRLREVARYDVGDRMNKISCPVLVLHGKNDWLVPKSSIAAVKRVLPRTVAVELDCEHMLLQTHARDAARAIEDFVQTIAMDA